jgi:hypothetical protein
MDLVSAREAGIYFFTHKATEGGDWEDRSGPPTAGLMLCLFGATLKSRSDRFHRQEKMKRVYGRLEKLRMMTTESPGFIIACVHQ